MIWRNDDVGYLMKVEDFKKVHEFFNERKLIHTLAILTKDLEKNEELVKYIQSQDNIDCQVHSYEHIDFVFASDIEIKKQLNLSIIAIQKLFGKKATIFYPPFNSCDERVIKIAKECGLETSYEKASPLYYIKHNGNVMQKVINYHSWDYAESILIDVCLKIYNERNIK